jgi:hypothetical protein
MKRAPIVIVTAGLVLAAAAAWIVLRPVTPVDTPYFQWQRGEQGRYQLAVSHVAGNPEFRRGVTTTPVPRSGALRVTGTANPGAFVEVSNPRTGRGYLATADASGAFAVDAEAQRGDTLKVISREIEFRMRQQPRYSSAVVSSP